MIIAALHICLVDSWISFIRASFLMRLEIKDDKTASVIVDNKAQKILYVCVTYTLTTVTEIIQFMNSLVLPVLVLNESGFHNQSEWKCFGTILTVFITGTIGKTI